MEKQRIAVGLGIGDELRTDGPCGAGFCTIGSITAANGRPTTSAAPPGGKGLTSTIAWLG
jgi:hypothetical protein